MPHGWLDDQVQVLADNRSITQSEADATINQVETIHSQVLASKAACGEDAQGHCAKDDAKAHAILQSVNASLSQLH